MITEIMERILDVIYGCAFYLGILLLFIIMLPILIFEFIFGNIYFTRRKDYK